MKEPTLFDFPSLGPSDLSSRGRPLSWNMPDLEVPKIAKVNKQRQVLDMLIQDGSTTAFDIQKATNSTDARKIISRLRKEGFIGKTEQVVGHSGIKHAVYYWSGKK